jgi:hypothetical protein
MDYVGKQLKKCGTLESVVFIAMGYRLDSWSSNPGRGKKFYLFHKVQTGSGVHPACHPMATRGSFPGSKATGA